MKKILPFLVIAVLTVPAFGQDQALKIEYDPEAPVYNVAHVKDVNSLAAYRGDEGYEDSVMVVNADGPWTVEIWVKPTVLDKSLQILSGGNSQFRLQHFDSHPGEWWAPEDALWNAVGFGTLGQLGGGEWDDIFGDPGYLAEVGEWQHLAIVFDKFSLTLIVNGIDEHYLSFYHNQDEDYTGYDAPAYGIGDNETGWMPTAMCEIDNYRVWDIARTMEQIATDMGENVPTDASGLIANYTFDDNVNNVADDSRHMVLNPEAGEAVSYIASTAPKNNTGILRNQADQFSVYPNPASDVAMIKCDRDLTGAMATIFDITGSKVITRSLNNSSINISELNTGMYFIMVSADNETFTAKLSVK